MAKRIKDLVVKTGEYTNGAGETKPRYENVGGVFERDDGGKFLMIKRTFNPAGVANPNDSDMLILSMFDVKDGDNANGGGSGGNARGNTSQGKGGTTKGNSKPAMGADEDPPF